MAIQNNDHYLKLLSDFWINFYEDHSVLNAALGSISEIIKSHYFTLVQRYLPVALKDFPVFQEQFWNVLELPISSRTPITINNETYVRYNLDETYVHIPFLYNIVYGPTITLEEKKDYEIIVEDSPDSLTSKSFIAFKPDSDPFLISEVARRRLDDDSIVLSLFAPKSFLDSSALYKEFGVVLGVKAPDSPEYRDFLSGVLFLYTQGPSIAAMNAGLNLAAGYPVARQDEIIINIEVGESFYTLYSNEGNSYEIARFPVKEIDPISANIVTKMSPILKFENMDSINALTGEVYQGVEFSNPSVVEGDSFNVWFPIRRLDSFLTQLRVVDNDTEPNWWRQQRGLLSSSLIPSLPQEMAEDPYYQEYLFQKYFKYNTFGVFLDYRILRKEFQKLGDFFNILQEIKPTFKNYVVKGENSLFVFSVMDEGSTLENSSGDPIGVVFTRDLEIQSLNGFVPILGMDVRSNPWSNELNSSEIGAPLEDCGFSLDSAQFHVGFGPENIVENRETGPGFALTLGSEIELGAIPEEGGVWEFVTFYVDIPITSLMDPPETSDVQFFYI